MVPAVCLSVQFDQLVCSCRGDFDLCARPVLLAAADDITADRHQAVVLDLSNVSFLDCGGARLLARTMRSCVSSGKSAVVVCPDGLVHRLLAMTGFSAEFPVMSAALPAASAHRGRELRLVPPIGDQARSLHPDAGS